MAPIRTVADALDATLRPLARPRGRSLIGVAVSGGPDSIALALGLARLRDSGRLDDAPVALWHVHHGAHAAAEDTPERVTALAAALGFGFARARIEPSSRASESALRDARYAALAGIARRHGAHVLLTGHHADDDVETVLLRVMRGTGPRGLAGVPRVRPWLEHCVIARPLLQLPRATLQRCAAESPVPPVDDPGNRDLRRARNRARHELIPAWRARFVGADPARLLTLARAARRRADRLERDAEAWLGSRAVAATGDTLELPDAPVALAAEVLRLAHRALVGLDPPRAWLARALELRRTGSQVHGGSPVIALRTRFGLRLRRVLSDAAGGIATRRPSYWSRPACPPDPRGVRPSTADAWCRSDPACPY